MMRQLSRLTFWTMVQMGRPFGGVRPRRIYRWLGNWAFPVLRSEDYVWHRDEFGHQLRLNPYFQIDREIIAFGSYDATLHHYLESIVKPGQVCLDVGANLGGMTVHLGRLVGPKGQVHAFEPNPAMQSRLREHITENQLDAVVQTHAIALSNRIGEITLHCPSLEQRNHGTSSIANAVAAQLTQDCAVRTTTLDRFVSEHEIEQLDLIKVDIQGAEMMFLEGATRTLARFSPRMLMEVSPEDLSSISRTPGDLVRMLDELSYEVFEVRPDGLGPPLHWNQLPDDYSASNILCVRRI